MSHDMPPVKTRANRRREQAVATRRRIVDAAYRSFSEAGYASTTMDAVAAAAGVAVQTVYHVFNTKAALLKEVVTVAAAGEFDPPLEPAWLANSLGADDGRRGVAVMIERGISSGARVAPLIASIHGAESTDPSFADFWEGACAVRRASTATLVARLAELGELRPDLDAQRAADIFYAVGSHESLSSFTPGPVAGQSNRSRPGTTSSSAISCCRMTCAREVTVLRARPRASPSIASSPRAPARDRVDDVATPATRREREVTCPLRGPAGRRSRSRANWSAARSRSVRACCA